MYSIIMLLILVQAFIWPLLTLTFVFFSLLFSSAHCFSLTSEISRKLIFMGPFIFTELEGICKKMNIYIYFTEADFLVFFRLFMAYVRSRHPGPTLVPGVLKSFALAQTQNTSPKEKPYLGHSISLFYY